MYIVRVSWNEVNLPEKLPPNHLKQCVVYSQDKNGCVDDVLSIPSVAYQRNTTHDAVALKPTNSSGNAYCNFHSFCILANNAHCIYEI